MARKPKPLPVPQAEPEAVALVLPNAMSYDEWLGVGRDIMGKKRSIDWMVADWAAYGAEHHAEQMQLDLPEVMGDDRLFRRVVKTAKTFPPHMRDSSLSFQHHAELADLETQEALPLLKEAKAEKLDIRQLRARATDMKVDTGKLLPREDDPDNDDMNALTRAWNCATKVVRQDFAELVRESQCGPIDLSGKYQ